MPSPLKCDKSCQQGREFFVDLVLIPSSCRICAAALLGISLNVLYRCKMYSNFMVASLFY